MAQKTDVKSQLGEWNDYAQKPPDEAASMIYTRVKEATARSRGWYWTSIATKRQWSRRVRGVSVILLIMGALLPIMAGIDSNTETSLLLTQLGVAALAAAGLVAASDKIFGWSSGWMRYVTTATAMENATRAFELDWADVLLKAPGGLTTETVEKLFALGRRCEETVAQLQTEETDQWVAEFNSGMALLGELIKSQREVAERRVEEARTRLTSGEADGTPGGIQVKIVHKAAPVPLRITLDSEAAEEFTGTVWVKQDVSPGLHRIRTQTVNAPVVAVDALVTVPQGGTGHAEISLP